MNSKMAIAAVFGCLLALGGCSATKANLSGKIEDEGAAVTDGILEKMDAPAASGEITGGGAVAEAPAPAFADQTGDQREGLPESDDRLQQAELQQRLVYFEYDRSAVSPDQLAVIEAHARFLVDNPDKGVLLEGHADERGSNEYNLALGQRRANAVRDIMLANGVGDYNIETISFGEERPLIPESNEAAWAENRRVEIRYRDE